MQLLKHTRHFHTSGVLFFSDPLAWHAVLQKTACPACPLDLFLKVTIVMSTFVTTNYKNLTPLYTWYAPIEFCFSLLRLYYNVLYVQT